MNALFVKVAGGGRPQLDESCPLNDLIVKCWDKVFLFLFSFLLFERIFIEMSRLGQELLQTVFIFNRMNNAGPTQTTRICRDCR